MIKEVAFVAIAVSDFKRSRKFYEETLELKPDSAPGDFPWAEYDARRNDHRRRSASDLAAVARRNDDRV